MEKLSRVPPERIEKIIGPDTSKLFYYFRILNAGRPIEIDPLRSVTEALFLAALLRGQRDGEIIFNWVKSKKKDQRILEIRNEPFVEKGKIKVIVDKRLLDSIEESLEAIGGVLPTFRTNDNIFGKLKKVNQENRWRVEDWPDVYATIIAAYRHYIKT